MKEALSDRVFLERLSVCGRHGVHEEERAVEQEFLIDISASVDTRLAAQSDRIEDAVDYSRFRDAALEIVRGDSCYLVESLAERIAARLLEDPRLQSVTVSVRKPAVYQDCLPGISITRSRV